MSDWRDSVRIYHTRQVTTPMEHPASSDPRYLEHVARSCGASLGTAFVRDGVARHTRREEEGPYGNQVVDEWEVAVVFGKDRVAEFSKQLDEHRRKGMEEAASIVAAFAGPYQRLDGPCAHVIRHSLLEAAEKVRREAALDTPPSFVYRNG